MIRHKTFIDSAIESLQKILKPVFIFALKRFFRNLPFMPFAFLYKTALKTGIVKRNRLLAPGKALFYQPYSASETILVSPFISMWFSHFGQKADFGFSKLYANAAGPIKHHECIENIVEVPDTFGAKYKFFKKEKYNTVVFLFPYPYYDLAFLLMLSRTVNRLGLDYAGKNPFLSSSLRFNEYNAHITHQVKTLLEETLLTKMNVLPPVFSRKTKRKEPRPESF